ncbi:hypothetical protein DVH24_035283 [Malus domestica]|uniref:Uncharacterized protein n=1 Tax=Malus domestica TaxID=3750 RepID=A0A498J422_MALDO|nr:hypothetical protein DVH24_035283 [Malus domestica]
MHYGSWFDLSSSHPTGVSPPPSSNFLFLVKFRRDLRLVDLVSFDLVLPLGRVFQTPSPSLYCLPWMAVLELVDGIVEARLDWGMGCTVVAALVEAVVAANPQLFLVLCFFGTQLLVGLFFGLFGRSHFALCTCIGPLL